MHLRLPRKWRGARAARSAGLTFACVVALAACSAAPEGASDEHVGASNEAYSCGGQCQVSCITGCNRGYHYSWQQARCVSDDGCDDGYLCDFGPCGGAGQRACNTASTGCSSCRSGYHYDSGSAECQASVPAGKCDDGHYYSPLGNALGPCGGAGQRSCDQSRGCNACDDGFFFNGAGPCHDGICLEVTDRCEPLPPAAPNVPAHADLTFFVANDIHIFRGWGDWAYKNNVWVMNNANAAFPTGWPSGTLSPGQPIGTPAGVVIAGDLTTCADCALATYSTGEINPFRDLYDKGRTADSIDFPVYLGLGNHDYATTYQYYSDNASSSTEKNDAMIAYMQSRMNGQMGVTSYDTDSQNYSWDWGGVHFVQGNLWPGAIGKGLDWLKNDLAAHVGTSKRPVVLFQHYGWDSFSKAMTDATGASTWYDDLETKYRCAKDAVGEIKSCVDGSGNALSWTWWSYDDRASLKAALAGYEVAAIFTGHLHNVPAHLDASDAHGPGFDVYRGSSGGGDGAGGFLAVHMNDAGMDVMHLGWSNNGAWDKVTTDYRKLIETNVWSKRFTPRSCSEYLGQHPHAQSGYQTIDPDGLGGAAPIQAYCDMTDGGGWTLIASTDGHTTWSESSNVTPGSATYMPAALVQALARNGTQVNVRSTGVDTSASSHHVITSQPGSLPIQNLRNLVVLNAGVTAPASVWTGDPDVIANQLWFNCIEPPYGAAATPYPALVWSCGNGNGLHILANGVTMTSTWSAYGAPSEPMEVFVR